MSNQIGRRDVRCGNIIHVCNEEGVNFVTIVDEILIKAGMPNSSGIPLTDEWLTKFGFEKDVNNEWEINELECFRLRYANRPQWWELWVNSEYNLVMRHFKYVHQLQNLYFALTGEELTIKS